MENDPRLGLPSASQEWRWGCCGSTNMWASLGFPEQIEEDEWAARGTLIHKAFETGNVLPLEEEELETYNQGLKFLEQLLSGWQWDRQLPLIHEGPREERYWIRSYGLEPLASAQLDRHYLSGGEGMFTEACIIDLKTGFVPNLSPSPKSTQLRVQLVALKEEHPQLQHVRVAYCKAKLKAGAADWADYGPDEIAFAEQWVRLWLWQSGQPDAPRTPGKHCGYCPCKGSCPEGGAYSMLPSVIAQRAILAPDMDAVQAVAVLAPADLLKIWSASGVIKKILEAVTARLKAMPDEQLSNLGLGRGKARETRSITVNTNFLDRLRAQGWADDEIYACLKVANEPFEQQMRKLGGYSSDKATKEAIKKEFADLTTITTSEPPLKTL